MRYLFLPVFMVTLLGFMTAASADDVDVEVLNKVLHGKDKPSITVTFNRDVRDATIEIRGVTRNVQRFKTGRKKAGQTYRANIKAPPGNFDVRGNLSVVFADGAVGEMPLHFSIIVAAPMTIEAPYERIFQQEGRMQARFNRPLNHCDIDLLYEDGSQVQERTVFEGASAGQWLDVQWSVPQNMQGLDHVVLRIKLNCYDVDYFTNGIELTPWWLEIPHDDVIFATGSWAIDTQERAKIDDVLALMQSEIAKYGRWISLGLYISGHTDTVGEAETNKQLGHRRAGAIANYLKTAGIKIPLFYRGTGEQELAVETADNIDEPRNRRARYLLSNGAPNAKVWKKL